MCCGGTAKWKRETVPDHKFDFIDVRDYHSRGCFVRLRYMLLYALMAKSFLVYVGDIYTATTMLASDKWTSAVAQKCKEDCSLIAFDVAKWIFTGCIIFSFLLLAYEARKAKRIIASRDISYAFTNVMANNYYSLRSYDHFCFFCQINNSTKKKDDFAFFIFFTFKGWKRLLVADGPRQVINAIILFQFGKKNEWSTNFETYTGRKLTTAAMLCVMIFTTLVFAISLFLLIVAAIMYVPLLCYIQGNLKEYCCHKIDKRITELIKRKARRRLAKQAALAKKEAAGDFSHLKNKKGELMANPMPQPTLPKINLDDDLDMDDGRSTRTGYRAATPVAGAAEASSSAYAAGAPPPGGAFDPYYASDSKSVYPPYPTDPYAHEYSYDAYHHAYASASGAPDGAYAAQSTRDLPPVDTDTWGSQSQVHLTTAAAPAPVAAPYPGRAESVPPQYSVGAYAPGQAEEEWDHKRRPGGAGYEYEYDEYGRRRSGGGGAGGYDAYDAYAAEYHAQHYGAYGQGQGQQRGWDDRDHRGGAGGGGGGYAV